MPEPGSLREAVCVLVQRYEWEREYFKVILLTAATGKNNNALRDALTKFQAASFPFMERAKQNLDVKMRQMLDKAFATGPIRIKR